MEKDDTDSSTKTHELDLPLSANYNEVHVEHFVLDLHCDISNCIFHGKITLFLRGVNNRKESDVQYVPHLKLDGLELCITKCQSFELDESERDLLAFSTSERSVDNEFRITSLNLEKYAHIYQSLKSRLNEELDFESKKHFLNVKVPHLTSWESTVITISFTTQPQGSSLMWTKNQDGRSCVFTIGDAFNNRSLFPSQDMPQAMASWHCNITVPEIGDQDLRVLMTGEADPHIFHDGNGDKVFHYFSSYRMPASTFALAVGPWSCHILDQNVLSISEDLRILNDSEIGSLPRCRIHFPKTLQLDAVKLFSSYLPNCFASIASVLEPYPFQRLDILIAPDCFDSLGLACPNLLILSQSVLTSDLSLFYRVAHEICHSWFGILLGPRNWTEDWLTEGMCCYLEDIIHAKALQWSQQETHDRNELKSFLKYKVLKSELEYIPNSLQTLRPDGEMSADEMMEKSCVKNGIRSETAHVHYMKGFFLLKLLENTAGQESLLSAVKTFITTYKGKLFTSQEILEYFFSHCPLLRSSMLTVSSLCRDWLDSPGLPTALQSFPYRIDDNILYQHVLKQHQAIVVASSSKKGRKRKLAEAASHHSPTLIGADEHPGSLQQLLPDQVVLLFGMLLDHTQVRIPQPIMSSIRDKCSIHSANAEVQHAWCELVIQQRCKAWRGDVERFLIQHRAMGLYLYGELMISEDALFQDMAHRCYDRNRTSMPRAVGKELREILGLDGVEDEDTSAEVVVRGDRGGEGLEREGRGPEEDRVVDKDFEESGETSVVL